MEKFKRFSLIMILIAALGTGFGCGKKKVEMPTPPACTEETPDAAAELSCASEAISEGIVYFDFDKFDIKPEYCEMLRQKSELLKKYTCIHVRIEGNCDARGTQEYNLALGERRARAAYEYLVMLGVNPAQLEIISYGKERPAVPGTGPEVWAKNRRDDFKIISQ